MAGPPKPACRSRSPPGPKLSRQTDESIASQQSSHVNTKILSSRHTAADPNKTTYNYRTPRTPPPRYPPPILPQKKATPTVQAFPVPKPRKSPVPKPRNATKSVVDTVYEDPDKDETSHKVTVQISHPENKDNLAATYRRDKQTFSREIPPALPPKNVMKEKLPPLPPRAISPNRRHVVVNSMEYGRLKDCVVGDRRNQEPVEDAELYEPMNYDAYDEESDSDESCSESQKKNCSNNM